MLIRRLMILAIRFRNPDPLSKKSATLPSIEVVIPIALKDLHYLEKVLISLKKYCNNPISKIIVICPNKEAIKIPLTPEITVFSDKDFLDLDLDLFRSNSPDIYGWCVQQLIKIKAVITSNSRYVLWLDSDTLLNQHRAFVNSKYILEIVSDEFHLPYFIGLNKTLGFNVPKFRFSRVSHHALVDVQLFNQFALEKKMGSEMDWKNVIVSSLDYSSKAYASNWFIFGKSSFSEYELNSLILKKYNAKRKTTYWWNESRSRETVDNKDFIEIENGILENVSRLIRPTRPYSISFHSWNINS